MKVRHLFSALRIAATYSIMTTSSSKIADSFPVKTLTPIATSLTKPTYASLQIAQLQLNGNATSIASDSGDGILGHLQLTIKPAAYQAASQGNVPFIAPVNPGAAPVHANGATGAQIAETNRQWKEDRTIFRLYHEVDKALRNQVIDAVHPHYIRALHDNLLGYGSLTCLQLLDHLWTNYGTITQDELDQNVVEQLVPFDLKAFNANQRSVATSGCRFDAGVCTGATRRCGCAKSTSAHLPLPERRPIA